MTFINPGSGPVTEATEEQAATNMTAFIEELRQRGCGVASHERAASADYGEGRYAFTVRTEDGREVEVQMPGAPLDQVRQGYTRLYVDGSSWFWDFALQTVEHVDE